MRQLVGTILAEVGDRGLHVAKISRHVYNAVNTFFEPYDLEEIHHVVLTHLRKNCKGYDAMFERVEKGVYRLNPHSAQAAQLLLEFSDSVEEDAATAPRDDRQLMLF
ncbi:MAG: hypothetical protein J5682_05660 [Prevotella sp.]|nr:hypothetical protein [Prevotella sp.]